MGQAQSLTADHGNGKPSWFGSAFRAPLHLASSEGAPITVPQVKAVGEPAVPLAIPSKSAVETRAEPVRDKEAMLGQIRSNIAALRKSEQRVRDLEAGVAAMSERAKSEIGTANERAQAAEARAASEAARADAAEQRWQEAEARMGEILQIIASELEAPLPPALNR